MTTETSQTVNLTTGIALTDAASAKVASLLAQEGRDDLYLRVAVQPGGCSGLRYQLYFDDRSQEGDITRESVTKVSKSDAPWPNKNPMWGNPWSFGPGDVHQANSSTYLAEVAPGSGVWTSKGPWLQAAEMKWVDIVLPQ